MKLHERIESLRQMLQISHRMLAFDLALSDEGYGLLMQGHRRINAKLAERLQARFGAPAAWWLKLQEKDDQERHEEFIEDLEKVLAAAKVMPVQVWANATGALQEDPEEVTWEELKQVLLESTPSPES